MNKITRPRMQAIVATAAALMLLAGACSSDDSDETTTTSEASGGSGGGESAQTKKYNEEIQQELKDVGCYTGADDGIVGPETDAAIVAFQKAEGLTPDGEVGSKTQEALTKAVDAGTKVCDGSTPTSSTTTTTPSGGTAPCTGTAIAAGLPSGDTASSYICSDGFAGVSLSNGNGIILESVDGKWEVPGQDPCGSASAGIDPEILDKGCVGDNG
ncbi:MAG: peptidoglycan-binding protein [Actinomycetia bacterium]|nr:peptidoglycan-binding protein [Actinomycetes bacterium]